MKFATQSVRSLYKSGSLTAAARELARYKLDLVGVQDVTWEKGGTVKAGDYIFFSLEKDMNISIWEPDFFYTTNYQQLREWSLLMIRNTQFGEVAGVISLF